MIQLVKEEQLNTTKNQEEIELDVGTIIVATGYDPYDPSEKKEWSYEDSENVITGLELERYINASGPTQGHVVKPSDGETPEKCGFYTMCWF